MPVAWPHIIRKRHRCEKAQACPYPPSCPNCCEPKCRVGSSPRPQTFHAGGSVPGRIPVTRADPHRGRSIFSLSMNTRRWPRHVLPPQAPALGTQPRLCAASQLCPIANPSEPGPPLSCRPALQSFPCCAPSRFDRKRRMLHCGAHGRGGGAKSCGAAISPWLMKRC